MRLPKPENHFAQLSINAIFGKSRIGFGWCGSEGKGVRGRRPSRAVVAHEATGFKLLSKIFGEVC